MMYPQHTVKELDIWSKLRHANILQLLGIALFKDQLAMVSEWMEQGSIVSVVNKQPQVDRFALVRTIIFLVRLKLTTPASVCKWLESLRGCINES
jgi:hypothetical protein